MNTDLEHRVRTRLADATTPSDLTLDADAVTRLASRNHRRHRTGQALLGGMASLALLSSASWAGGWLPDPVQQALPASPWSGCPLTWNGTGSDVELSAVDHAVIALPDGGTVVAGVARGCPDGDRLFIAATHADPDALPETLPVQGGLEDRPGDDHATSWLSGLRLEDGQEVTAVMAPRGSQDTVIVGPDVVHEAATTPVRVPDTGFEAFVVADYWPDGEDLAQVWRGGDGLVHTAWSAGVTSRVWQGDDEAAEFTDTWVGQDRQEQQWVMRGGVVLGPFEVSAEPHAVAFTTPDPDRVELVVVLPEASGELALGDGTELETLWLDSSEGDRTLNAALVTLGRDGSGDLPTLRWMRDDAGGTSQVEILKP